MKHIIVCGLRSLMLLSLAAGVTGCASRLSSENFVGTFKSRFDILAISYNGDGRIRPRYSAVADTGFKAEDLDWSRHKDQTKKDMLALSEQLALGLEQFLVPAVRERGVKVLINEVSGADGQLRIKPTGFRVDCGAMNLICTSKMTVEVILVDYRDDRPMWTAQFSVGREFGAEQTGEVAQTFYNQLRDRLVQMNLI